VDTFYERCIVLPRLHVGGKRLSALRLRRLSPPLPGVLSLSFSVIKP